MFFARFNLSSLWIDSAFMYTNIIVCIKRTSLFSDIGIFASVSWCLLSTGDIASYWFEYFSVKVGGSGFFSGFSCFFGVVIGGFFVGVVFFGVHAV